MDNKGTVFNRIGETAHPNEALAIMVHRATVLLYGSYAMWGFLSIIGFLYRTITDISDLPMVVFSGLIALSAALSAIGALRFPTHARLELFASSAFVTLLGIYVALHLEDTVHGSVFSWAGQILVLSYLILPITRVAFIYLTLVRNARRRG